MTKATLYFECVPEEAEILLDVYHVNNKFDSFESHIVRNKTPFELSPYARVRGSCFDARLKDKKIGRAVVWNAHQRNAFFTFDGSRKVGELIIQTANPGPMMKGDWFRKGNKMMLKKYEHAVRKNLRDVMRWIETTRPAFEILRDVHMPFFHNSFDEVPGWFFMKNMPEADEDEKMFERVFRAARLLLGVDKASFERTCAAVCAGARVDVGSVRECCSVLAVGYQLVASSIEYRDDVNCDGGLAEIFSSDARRSGFGDCEDMAKEIIMLDYSLRKNADWKGNVVRAMRAIARHFVAVLALGWVKGTTGHAFVAMIPASCFRDMLAVGRYDVENRAFDELRVPKKTMILDGTMLKHPYDAFVNPNNAHLENSEYVRGDKHKDYDYVVSAMLADGLAHADSGERAHEIYFAIEPGTYGVHFQALVNCGQSVRLFPTYLPSKELTEAAEQAMSFEPPVFPHAEAETNDGAWETAMLCGRLVSQRARLESSPETFPKACLRCVTFGASRASAPGARVCVAHLGKIGCKSAAVLLVAS